MRETIWFYKRMRISVLVLLILFSADLFSQQGWWTWLHGNATGAGTWGTQGVAAPANVPPGMYKTDACGSDSQGNFWFYGGGGNYSALWKYNPATNMWTWMKGSNLTSQPPVYGTKGVAAPGNNPPHMALGGLLWVDLQDKIWFFGGNNNSYVDLWKYDPVTNMWTWMHGPGVPSAGGNYGVQGVSSPANLPAARYETCATWVDNTGKLWMFGGWGQAGQLNDMWRYDPATNEWTWMKGSNTAASMGNYGVKGVAAATNNPPARWIYSRWKDNNGNFWMFGGTHWSNTQSMNDLWKFDPLTNNWTWMSGTNIFDDQPSYPQKCVPSTTTYPKARYENHVSWKDKCGNLWLFSGQWIPTLGVQNNSDIWCYKVATNEWVYVGGNVTPSKGVQGVPAGSNFPGDAFGAGAFVYNDQFYMFGGAGTAGGNYLWRYVPDSSCAQSFCNPQTLNPTANFNADSLIGCAPLTVYFTNTSTNATSWLWNFGDGNTSNAQHPVHTYPNPGNYTVFLIAYNGPNSDTLTYVNYVNVLSNAVGSYSVQPNDTVCLGQPITLISNSSNVSSIQWNCPNEFKDTANPFTYTFSAPGVYPIYLYANHPFGCNDLDSFNIVVLNGFASTQSVSICSGGSYTLPGGSVVSTAGTYVDTLGSGACDSVITTHLTVTPPFTFTQNASICTGNTYTLPGGTIVSTAGTYIDSLSSVNGCDSIITTNLSVGNSVTVTQNAAICSGNTFVLPGGSVVSTAGTYIDTIPFSGGCDSIITTNLTVNPTAASSQSAVICSGNNYVLPGGTSVSSAGIYTDTLATSTGCDSIVTTTLTVTPASSSIQNAAICNGSSYLLPGGNMANTAGTYTDTLTTAAGCDSIITTNLTVNPVPVATVSTDVTITIGTSTTLSASGGGTYSWSPSAGLNTTTDSSVIAMPSSTTAYCVTVTNTGGCTDSACVNIAVEIICGSFYIPNAFSPNADMENDVFKAYIPPICVQEFQLIIYNRWGEKVFETNDVTETWSGDFRGQPSDPAVYAFYCHAVLINGQEIFKEGNVSLVR